MLLAVHSNLKYHPVLGGQFETFLWPKIFFYSDIIWILFFPQVSFSLKFIHHSDYESRIF